MGTVYQYSFISRNVAAGTADIDHHLNTMAAAGWTLVSATTNVLWGKESSFFQKDRTPDAVVFHAFYWESDLEPALED